jgi:hypothetical protein
MSSVMSWVQSEWSWQQDFFGGGFGGGGGLGAGTIFGGALPGVNISGGHGNWSVNAGQMAHAVNVRDGIMNSIHYGGFNGFNGMGFGNGFADGMGGFGADGSSAGGGGNWTEAHLRTMNNPIVQAIHQGQRDFLSHPVTKITIGTMTFVGTGGINMLTSLGIGIQSKLQFALTTKRFPGLNPSKAPKGFEWRGRPDSKPGSVSGNWYNPRTGETLRPDLNHPGPIGPHWDYRDALGRWWRLFQDGRIIPK